MPPQQKPLPMPDFGKAMNEALLRLITEFWPQILLFLIILFILAYLRGKLDRWEERRITERRVRDEYAVYQKIKAEEEAQYRSDR